MAFYRTSSQNLKAWHLLCTKNLKIIFFTGSVNVLISQRPIESAQMSLHLGWHQFVFGWLMYYFSTNIGIGLLNVWEKNFSILSQTKQKLNCYFVVLNMSVLSVSPCSLPLFSNIHIKKKKNVQINSPPPPTPNSLI